MAKDITQYNALQAELCTLKEQLPHGGYGRIKRISGIKIDRIGLAFNGCKSISMDAMYRILEAAKIVIAAEQQKNID